MNFFKLYIGDYQRDTAHMSVTEHGAYMLMLQNYYATEKPLPVGKALHRMLRAQDKTEREAIDAVVAQFWRTTDDGLVNDRADKEIVKASAQADTNRSIAQAREAARKKARDKHEQSTNRATNDQPNHSQTPDLNPPLPSAVSPPKPRPTRKCPEGFAVTDAMLDWLALNAPGVPWQTEHAKFTDHTFKTAISDWSGAWRNWMRKSQEFAAAKAPAKGSVETAYARQMREKYETIAPAIAAKRPGQTLEVINGTSHALGREDFREDGAGVRPRFPVAVGGPGTGAGHG